jgi:hypothetical protein
VSVVEPLIEPYTALIVVLPVVVLLTSACALMLAAAGVEELHNDDAVMSWVLESLKVPVAVNCLSAPIGIVELAGVTAIDTRVAAETVSEAVPLTDPDVAVIVVVPPLKPEATPLEVMVATEVDDELHVSGVSN